MALARFDGERLADWCWVAESTYVATVQRYVGQAAQSAATAHEKAAVAAQNAAIARKATDEAAQHAEADDLEVLEAALATVFDELGKGLDDAEYAVAPQWSAVVEAVRAAKAALEAPGQ